MGGAAGHIRNIWEVSEFTFKELKDIVSKSLSGKLKNISEKLDGQNILITFRNKEVLAARSTYHLKNFGENALDKEQLNCYFLCKETNELVRLAFINAIEDLQNVFNEIPIDLNEIFENGKNWLSIEILHTDTENVIPYNRNQLRIHHLRQLDEKGKTKNFNTEKLDILLTEIDKIKIETTFLIKKTNNIIVKNINDSKLIEKNLINKIEELKNSVQLNDSDTLNDFFEAKMMNHILESIKSEDTFLRNLAKRWGRGDKTTPINKLLKGQSEKIQEWVRNEEKNVKNLKEDFIEPFIEIFSELGIIILKNLENIASLNPEQSVKIILDKINQTIELIKIAPNKEFNKYFNKYKKLGGPNSITPIEGIVFEYNKKLLKLTGNFTSILRMIGIIRFNNENLGDSKTKNKRRN